MRAAVAVALRRWWAGEGGTAGRVLSAAALPAELLFRSAASLRARAYDAGLLRVGRAPLPVISVGNLTVGGTGKTPLVRWIASQLVAAGRRPALLVRGYGRDEVLLHRRWHPQVPVHVDPDRLRGARAAAAGGADVVLLDDGFQHRRLGRDLDIVVVAAEQPFPGALLPRGPYREPAGALARAGWVIVTRRAAAAGAAEHRADAVRALAPGTRIARARLALHGWTALDGGPAAAPASGGALAVTAIGDPASFAAMVERETGTRVERLDFPDHHEYSPADVARIRAAARGRTVITTEKDAVKLEPHAAFLPDARVLGVAIELEAGEGELRAALLAAAGADDAVAEAHPNTGNA